MNLRRSILNRDFQALLLVGAAIVWFGHEMVFAGKVPFYRDLGLYFYPIGFSVAESFKNAELPLWNRHMAMGFPLLAAFQSGAFYPPNLLYLLFPFFSAVTAIFLFHYFVAATGSYALCRNWGYPPYLAAVGAFLFTFGGMVVSLTNLLNHFQTAVWLPWVILFSERALRSGSWRDFLVFTVALLFPFLAGSPEVYLMSLGLAFLNSLRVRWAEEKISYLRVLFLPVAANALVFGLAMAQILPTLELFLESRWREPLGYVENPLYSFNPLSLINLFFIDKEVNLAAGQGVNFFFLRAPPFLVSYYLGTLALIGIVLWLFYASLKEKALLLGFAALALILAMGGYTSVYPFLHQHIPFMSFFRFPEKFFFLTSSLLPFAALRGVYFLAKSIGRSSGGLIFTFLAVGIPLLALYLFLRLDTAPLSRFIAWATQATILSTATLSKTSAVLVNVERQMALAFAALLLFFAWQRGKLRPRLFGPLIVALVLIDLGSAHRPYQFLLDPEFVYKSPKVLSQRDSSPYRLFYHPGPSNLHPSYYALPREPSFTEFQGLIYSNLLPNAGVFYGVDYMQEIDALRRWPYMAFLSVAGRLPPEALYRLLGALNVKYVLSFRSLEGGGARLMRHFPEYPSWLYELERAVPRVYVVSDVEVFNEPIQVVGRLAATEFDPLRKVILEETVPTESRGDFKGRAEIVRYENRRVQIRTSLNGRGILVLADSYYPGWRAYVNGSEERILRANLFFRAVPLPAGEHFVEFRYEPRSFRAGLVISLITLGGIAVATLIMWPVRKKLPHPGLLPGGEKGQIPCLTVKSHRSAFPLPLRGEDQGEG